MDKMDAETFVDQNDDTPAAPSHPLTHLLDLSFWWNNDRDFIPFSERVTFGLGIKWALLFILLIVWGLYKICRDIASGRLNSLDSLDDLVTLMDRRTRRQVSWRRWSRFPWRLIWPSRNYVLELPQPPSAEQLLETREEILNFRSMIETSFAPGLILRIYAYGLRIIWEDVGDEFRDFLEFLKRVREEGESARGRNGPVGESSGERISGEALENGDPKEEEIVVAKTPEEIEKANWLHFLATYRRPENFDIFREVFRTNSAKIIELLEMDADLDMDLDKVSLELKKSEAGVAQGQGQSEGQGKGVEVEVEGGSSSSSTHLPSSSSSSTTTSGPSTESLISSSASSIPPVKETPEEVEVKKVTAANEESDDDWF